MCCLVIESIGGRHHVSVEAMARQGGMVMGPGAAQLKAVKQGSRAVWNARETDRECARTKRHTKRSCKNRAGRKGRTGAIERAVEETIWRSMDVVDAQLGTGSHQNGLEMKNIDNEIEHGGTNSRGQRVDQPEACEDTVNGVFKPSRQEESNELLPRRSGYTYGVKNAECQRGRKIRSPGTKLTYRHSEAGESTGTLCCGKRVQRGRWLCKRLWTPKRLGEGCRGANGLQGGVMAHGQSNHKSSPRWRGVRGQQYISVGYGQVQDGAWVAQWYSTSRLCLHHEGIGPPTFLLIFPPPFPVMKLS
ncbi:hypothetical protein BDV93DRAFT_510219 [Ceratobasidium sp. AG-I]|nr:hypothetical protein BDV93DRAFT_510219 [Ceratobasidium sp. AG-I]